MEPKLTFCQSCENVIYIISAEGRSLHMLNTLTPCKLIGILLWNSVVHNIALVSSQDDWCITANLMDQFFVPICRPLKWVFIRNIIYKQRTYKQLHRSVSQTKKLKSTYLRHPDSSSWLMHGTSLGRLYPKQRALLVFHQPGLSFQDMKRQLLRITVCRIIHVRT